MSYTLLSEIGSGGMGCVYKAKDNTNGNIVAVKMMSNQVTCYTQYRDLFYSEVETLKRMDHPNVVHIVGEPYGDNEGNLYLPMEFVEGITLEQYLSEKGPLSLEETTKIMCVVLDAIQYVHNKSRIHRDIKPSNIMYRSDGTICIIDFGIAKDARIGTGQTVGRIIGTDGYMSPEQANGLNIDSRTDIYSLGCVLFFLLTGRQAIVKGNNDYETVNNILNSMPNLPSELVPGLPKQIDSIFLKAVDKNMMKRFQTAYEFKESLRTLSCVGVPVVTIGRASDNDIIINDSDVSRHHLTIRLITKEQTGTTLKFLEIVDNSTNGTGVNGKFLHHDMMSVLYSETEDFPNVNLSGKSTLSIDWSEVMSLLGVTKESQKKESSHIGIMILCFLFPIIGFILTFVYWQDKREKAKHVLLSSVIGFLINLLIVLGI